MPPETPVPQPDRAATFFEKHRTRLITLVFTDLVDSTLILSQLGDQAGATFMRRRRQVIRETLSMFSEGEEIETAGDSFLLVFPKPSEAARFAIQVQARLRAFSKESGLLVQERIGIHLGEVVICEHETAVKAKDLYGIQLATCSRVMALAQGGQILLTRGVFDSARQVLKGEDLPGIGPLSWLSHGSYQLKGIDEPVEVCEVGEIGQSPLMEPKPSDKARRIESAEAESVLGWRPALGQEVPNTKWLLEQKLGEGGFGEVWLARHQTMRERRVFKFCFRADKVRSLKREMTLFRLLKERIGDHPNIVRLLEVNFDLPPFYVVMDHVDGENLKVWCERQGFPAQLPLASRLEIVAQIADALQAAHDAGVIHRDVKPGNILVRNSRHEDLARHGPVAKLTDFGIGQVLSHEALEGLTRAGFTQTLVAESSSQTGSQMYMAPELLAGKSASTRSDIYSLGVVLFQLLIGDFTLPLTTDWPDLISDPLLRDDLKRCFAGNAHDRFAGAGQLAANLRALPHRHSERVREHAEMAAREKAAYRRGVLRTAAVAAVLVIAFASVAALAWTQWRLANATAHRLRINSYAADMKMAQVALDEKNRKRALELLSKYLPGGREGAAAADLRSLEWRYLWNLAHSHEKDTLATFESYARDAVFSPINPDLVATLSIDSTIRLLELPAKRTIHEFKGGDVDRMGSASLVAFSPDGQNFAAIRPTGVTIWDTGRWSGQGRKLDLEGTAQSLAYSPDGRTLAVCCDHRILLWDLETGHPTSLKTERNFGCWHTAAFSADSRLLAVASCSDDVQVWDLASASQIGAFNNDGCNIAVAFSPTASLLAAGNWGGTLRIWDYTSGANVGRVEIGASIIFATAFSPDGKTIALGCADSTIRLLDVGTLRLVRTLQGHLNEVWTVRYSQDGRFLVSASKDGTIKMWDATPQMEAPDSWLEQSGESKLDLLESGMLVNNGTNFWTLKEGKPTRAFTLHANPPEVIGLCFSSDGQAAAFGKKDGTIEIYECGTGRCIKSFKPGENALLPRALSRDMSLVVLGRQSDTTGSLWDVRSGTQIGPLPKAQLGDVGEQATFSANGRLLAYVADHHTIKLWEVLSRRELPFAVRGHHWGIVSLSFSPDDKLLLSTSVDNDARLWDVQTGRMFGRPLTGHIQGLRAGRFSPDGRTVITADQASVRFWNVATGQEVICRRDLRGFLLAADGNTLVLEGAELQFVRIPTLGEIDAIEIARKRP